jgi:hypothetical protein
MTNASFPEVARGETHVAAVVSALRALEQSPTQASIERAMAMAIEIGQALVAAARAAYRQALGAESDTSSAD